MKRAFCICVVILLITLAGCGKRQDSVIVPMTEGIDCEFNANYNGLNIKGNLKIPTDGNPKMMILSPDVLSGMTLEFLDNSVKVSYLGLNVDMKPDEMPQTAFASIMMSALKNAASSAGITVNQLDGGFELLGNCDVGKYSLVLDNSMRPTRLTFKALGFDASFSKFK